MLTSVVSVTLRLVLFRAGPQDLPYAPALTRVLVPMAMLVNFLLAVITLPPAMAALSSAMAVTGLAIATRSLLRLRHFENRYTQTFHALLTSSSLLALGLLAPMNELMPAMLKLAENPALLDNEAQMLALPAGPVLLFDALMIWNFAVSANIYRQAMDMKWAGGILTALLVSMSLLMFVGFSTSVIGTLFGFAQPQAAHSVVTKPALP